MNRSFNRGRHLAFGILTLLLAFVNPAPAGVSAAATPSVFISEVHPAGSGNGSYKADWFEVTNTGTAAVDITGWKMDDSSNAFATAVALNGVTSIPAGGSVVFIENTTPVDINAFLTAWFGTNVPSGFTVGTYGGSGVGLGTGGDAVNLFDASGARVTGVSFGAATANATFDNTIGAGGATLPLPTIATSSVAGVNGAFRSFDGAETGSPGRRINASPISTLDLSLYVRVGRFDLPEPTRTAAPANSLLAQEVSAVTYNWDTDTLFVVGDGGTSVVQVTKTGELIDSMTLAAGGSPQNTDFYDPEGLTYVGGGKFVMSEERDRQAVVFTYAAGTTLTRSGAQTVKLGTFVQNIGIEGISYDPLTGGFIAVKETEPEGIFQTNIDFAAGTATNGSPTTENSINLFDPALANLLDFADVYALSNLPYVSGPDASHLLVLSQESGKVVNIDRNGTVFNSLTILSDPGNPLSVPAQQHEGLTMDGNGVLYIVSENGGGDFDHPQLWVYAPSLVPNQAPSGLALTNQVNAMAENTSTASRIKVADIVVTDDGLGTNNLSVAGADAGFFEVDSTGLYIKAGTILDFETKASYGVTVAVDDPTLGSTPDATASYALSVSDVVEETPPQTSIVISEVAPWSSGNSPVGADWFELTNTGASAVNIAGWRMDDSSNAFATSVALNGVSSIGPGESVIFIETGDLAGAAAAFRTTWFGANPPAGLQIGSYSGSGVGLSTGGDGVNVYDASGAVQASVSFGTSPASAPFATFDNAAGVNNATISLLSAAGVRGAFVAATDANEIGSPGTVGPVGKLIISEVAPWSSGNSPVGADWFEVTNVGGSAVDITGWKVDDSSESFVAAVPLSGITAIAPGESVIFIETGDVATAAAAFRSTWFGANPPPALQIGGYSGGGVGLSTGGDAVNLYNSSGLLQARVFFGVSPAGPVFATFDNAAGLNNAAISQLSVAGVHGAIVAASDANEIGSPGAVANVDTDHDDDGIADIVDPMPLDATNETFSDAPAPSNGSTSGRILARNGKTLTIVDAAPNPATGVQVVVSGAGDGLVQIQLDDKADTISLPNGDYVLTDPLATSTVAVGAGGPAQIAAVLNGFPVAIIVGSGSSIAYSQTPGANGTLTGLRVDAVTGSVTLNGAALSAPLTLAGPPPSGDACKKGGWQTFNFPVSFANQGDCVSFVTTSNRPPKVKVPANQRVEATGPSGAAVAFTATATDQLEGALPVTCTPASGSMFPLGETTVTCSAMNHRGKGDADTFRVTVRDTNAPDIISLTPSVTVLPDTNQTVPVSIAVAVADVADPAPVCQIIRVAGQGKDVDHDGVVDWTITGSLTLDIAANARKQRDRTYTITVKCTDASGNPSREKTAIVISRVP